MFRCIGCDAMLDTAGVLMSNRDRPFACAGCGLRQYSPRVRWLALIVAAISSGLLAAWLAEPVGVDAFALWLGAMIAAMAAERFVAYRQGRMRAWTFSATRARAWLGYYLVIAVASVSLSMFVLTALPDSLADGPTTRVDGIVERRVGTDCPRDCLCVTLVGASDRFSFDSPAARRLLGGELPAELRAGASVTLHVSAAGLTAPLSQGTRQVVGLSIGDITLFSPADVAAWERGQRRAAALWGAMIATLFAFLAWLQFRSMRRDATHGAAREPQQS